jgi:hypothetical protein
MLAFILVERMVAEPMLPPQLFRRPSFTGVQVAAFAVSSSAFALFLYVSLYFQNYLGYSPLQAGLRYLPITITSFFAAPLAAALLSRVPARLLLAGGLATTGAGLLMMAGVGTSSPWTALLAGLLVVGVGAGFLGPVIADVALSVVPAERSGMAAGINDTFRQVGVAVGVAVWGAIFVGRGAAKIRDVASGTPIAAGDHPRQLIEATSSGVLQHAATTAPAPLRHLAIRAGHEGFIAGFNDVLTLGALVSLAGALLALWLVREREIEREPMGPAGHNRREATQAGTMPLRLPRASAERATSTHR